MAQVGAHENLREKNNHLWFDPENSEPLNYPDRHTNNPAARNSATKIFQIQNLPCAPNAGDLDSISDQGTRSHMLQLRVRMLQLKTPIVVV